MPHMELRLRAVAEQGDNRSRGPARSRYSMNAHKTSVKVAEAPGRFLLPDIPEKHPDDMTSSR